MDVLKLVYDGLLTLDEKGNVGPGGATGCAFSSDGKSLTCTIRDGLMRADGTPITARDYEYALRRAVDPRVPDRVLNYALFDIEGARALDRLSANATSAEIDKAYANYGVKTVDSRTLVITFDKPIGYWPSVAATLVSFPTDQTLVDKDPSTWWSTPAGHNGNGPFKIQSIVQGKNIVLTANDHYWRGRPKLDRIEFVYFADVPAMLAAYKAGAIDLASTASAAGLAAIDQDATLSAEAVRAPAAISYALAFNSARKPFDNKNVRIAFSQAFDREGWVRQVLQGAAKPYTRWIPPGVPGAQPDKPGVPAYDPNAAVLTLVNNGYAAAGSTADNPKVDCNKLGGVELDYVGDSQLQFAAVEFLAGDFGRVFNCPISLVSVSPSKYDAPSGDPSTLPMISLRIWVEDYAHPQDWLSVYWTCSSAYSLDYAYCSQGLDTQLDKADGIVDTQKALEAYQAAEDMLMADVPAAFASYGEIGYLIKPYVIGPKDHVGSDDLEWAGEWGPVWEYDVDLTRVPSEYPR